MEDKISKLYRCDKHPKYRGRKQPVNGCVGCLNVYCAMHKAPRMPIKPTKIIKDKTKYSRKGKHSETEF